MTAATPSTEPLSCKYFTATKLVNFIEEAFKNNKLSLKPISYEFVRVATVWFNGFDVYNGQFDDYVITKPLYMRLHTSKNRDLFLNYDQILNLFKAKPKISLKQNMRRTVPSGKDRQLMFYASIHFEAEQASAGFTYYPVDVEVETNKSRINTVKKSNEPKEIDPDALK